MSKHEPSITHEDIMIAEAIRNHDATLKVAIEINADVIAGDNGWDMIAAQHSADVINKCIEDVYKD